MSSGIFEEESDGVLVTTFAYRACGPGTGGDPLIFTDYSSFGGGHRLASFRREGRNVAFEAATSNRDLVDHHLAVVDLRTGAKRTFFVWAWPRADHEWVLLPEGSVAWIEHFWSIDTGDTVFDRVMLGAPDGTAAELDRAGEDQLTGLRAEGSTLRWSHTGEPRSFP